MKELKCIVNNTDLIYATENDELPVLEYLKMIGEDIKNFTTPDYIVKSCFVEFNDVSVNLELIIINDNIDKLSNDFNSFCQNMEWCDKKTLFINKEDNDFIIWDCAITVGDFIDTSLSACTDFNMDGKKMYVSVKLD